MDELNVPRIAHRTAEQRRGVLDLPGSLATLEKKIQDVAAELGSQEFLQLSGPGGKYLPIITNPPKQYQIPLLLILFFRPTGKAIAHYPGC